MWKIYALLSALFSALTAICAKVVVKDVDSNLATAISTSVILFITWGIVFASGHLQEVKSVSRYTWVFLILYTFRHIDRLVVAVLFQGNPDW